MSLLPYPTLFLLLGIAIPFCVGWKIASILLAPYLTALRDLPGPPSSSWLYGSMKEMKHADFAAIHEDWVAKYGKTFKYKEWMNFDRLYTIDTRALGHILSHSNDFPKQAVGLFFLSQVVGSGLLIVGGEQHRRQRRVLNPAFGPAQIRELTSIFVEKAHQLRDVWNADINGDGEPHRVEVLSGLSKMTLDVIGLAGFNYHFDALNPHGQKNELNEAFTVMFRTLSGFNLGLLRILKGYFPLLRLIPDKYTRRIDAAQSVMRRIGMELITEKKAELAKAAETGVKGEHLKSRDLLTLLLKANMSEDVPLNQRLSDDEVLAQVPTFLVAGHETTSNATAWCLFALAHSPEVQQRLREELFSLLSENPSMDELNELPYLDAVIRETMRVHAPVPSTSRIAAQDDVIPLETPVVDVNGQVHNTLKVSKGNIIQIPILVLNRSKELWGEDAHEFKPERWITGIPDSAKHIPGVWGHMLSFLGGPRACIGYRFSLIEMKALIFSLIRAFEFQPAVPYEAITRKLAIVQRPYVRGEMEKGSQLPLLIRRYQRT
ncbi:uncharacterized protein FIBRA_03029 [Fibroporia radiculosa]|uniref:Cytochrome P450 n=1 Tax=Fibroporia radiculosa TaxID=599839 RepID=J4I9D7_9APHY|nr:uncharacterized protein FIBRA_03029 [Fibroporia radiculosa]CCM00981.1 predicted protein [Fibroporia radiculosa]